MSVRQKIDIFYLNVSLVTIDTECLHMVTRDQIHVRLKHASIDAYFKYLIQAAAAAPSHSFLTRIFIIISPVLTTLLIISSNKKQSWIKVSRFDQKMMLSPLHFLFIRLLGDYSGLVNDNSGWMTRLNLNLIFIFECNYE